MRGCFSGSLGKLSGQAACPGAKLVTRTGGRQTRQSYAPHPIFRCPHKPGHGFCTAGVGYRTESFLI